MKTIVSKILMIIFLNINTVNIQGQDTWSFVSAPDWHLAEKELFPPVATEEIALQENTINDMKNYNPELLLIAGDLVSGPWVRKTWIDRFAAGGTQIDAIYNVCKTAYGNLKQRFEQNGFNKILVALGDHEIGDDSNWKPGGEVSHLISVYRDAFQQIWNRDKEGNFLYTGAIGKASSRPGGTPWENTSFAYRYKNVLFVTVDIWDQPDPDKPAGYSKYSIYANMPKEHLCWFENVLKEAGKNPEIKHIIVQAHSPVLTPVRGQRTSMLYVEHFEKSPFWKTMQKYHVDLYFAGEVHAPSAQQIKDKFPVQVVHGAPFGRNYLIVEVSDNKLHLKLRELNNREFSCIGEMTIDKSSKKTVVNDSGMLKIIGAERPLIHYTFDEKKSLSANPPLGCGFTQHFLDEKEHLEIPNLGQMDRYYNLYTEAKLTDGIRGKAIEFNGTEVAKCQGAGVMTGSYPLTLIAWVRTSQQSASCIVAMGGRTGNFDIGLTNGKLAVFASGACLTGSGTNINTGEWHQLAVVFPAEGKTLNDVRLYVDGILQKKQLIGTNPSIMINPSYLMTLGNSLGGKQFGLQNFIGSIDELSVWYKPLSDSEVKSEYLGK